MAKVQEPDVLLNNFFARHPELSRDEYSFRVTKAGNVQVFKKENPDFNFLIRKNNSVNMNPSLRAEILLNKFFLEHTEFNREEYDFYLTKKSNILIFKKNNPDLNVMLSKKNGKIINANLNMANDVRGREIIDSVSEHLVKLCQDLDLNDYDSAISKGAESRISFYRKNTGRKTFSFKKDTLEIEMWDPSYPLPVFSDEFVETSREYAANLAAKEFPAGTIKEVTARKSESGHSIIIRLIPDESVNLEFQELNITRNYLLESDNQLSRIKLNDILFHPNKKLLSRIVSELEKYRKQIRHYFKEPHDFETFITSQSVKKLMPNISSEWFCRDTDIQDGDISNIRFQNKNQITFKFCNKTLTFNMRTNEFIVRSDRRLDEFLHLCKYNGNFKKALSWAEYEFGSDKIKYDGKKLVIRSNKKGVTFDLVLGLNTKTELESLKKNVEKIKMAANMVKSNFSDATISYKKNLNCQIAESGRKYDFSLDAKNVTKKNINDEIKHIQKEIIKDNKKKIAEFESMPLRGSLLAIAIVELVKANQKHITPSGAVKLLRGLAMSSSFNYTKTDDCGLFSPISSDAVSDMIDDLVRLGILRTRTVHGDYGNYEILLPSDKTDSFIAVSKNIRAEKYKLFERLTEWEVLHVLQNVNVTEVSKETRCKNFLYLCEHPAVYCKAPEEARKYVAGVAEKYVGYVKTLMAFEKEPASKRYKKMMIGFAQKEANK